MVTHEEAWFAIHEALPPYWAVGPITFDPAAHRWSVTARSAARGRGHFPVTVSGTGVDDLAALVDLHVRLIGMARPADEAEKRSRFEQRLRLAFYQGAEEWTREATGTSLDPGTLARILVRYPGR